MPEPVSLLDRVRALVAAVAPYRVSGGAEVHLRDCGYYCLACCTTGTTTKSQHTSDCAWQALVDVLADG